MSNWNLTDVYYDRGENTMLAVSVIVPVYNTEKYLRKCMESLVKQTMQNIEFICVNDGSTDKSLQILEEFASYDSRVKIISKSNSGYGDSMNTGLAHARGEYIGIVESDDYALPDMFSALYKEASEKKADIVKSNYNSFSEKEGLHFEESLSGIKYHKIFCAYDDPKILGATLSIWSALYRRKFLEEEGILFNTSPGASYQDVSFVIKALLSAKKIICIPEAYLCYRCDNENSSVKSPKKVFCIMEEFHLIYKYIYEKEKDNMLPIIEPIKFEHYLGNNNRIDSVYQYAFLDRMQKELQEDYKNGCMNKAYWTDDSWKIMMQIKSDMDNYFESVNIDYLNKYVLKEYTLNHCLADLGAEYILRNAKKIIIYGAGTYGNKVLDNIQKINTVFGFAITEKTADTPKEIKGIPVFEIQELQEYVDESVVVVAIKKRNQIPVLKLLKEMGYHTVLSVDKYFV